MGTSTGKECRGKARQSPVLRAAVLLVAFCPFPVQAADVQTAGLADLTLEQLGNIEVTSVSGRAERLSDAPAAIFVITSDDIRRSGARTLPEALRIAPNLQVARTSANAYAISARGFNNSNGLANKLLVLIDGRTVYSPVMSGVFWEQQDVMLEDVERIEVISGPGATLWGANAVNGVINVITRAARDSQGGLAMVGAGNRDQGAAFRYGGRLGDAGHFRVYGKTQEMQNTWTAADLSLADGWQRGQVGFRADWGLAPGRNFTLQGDAYSGKGEDRPVFGPIEVSGVNLLARWNERLSSGSELQIQAYYDRSERSDFAGFQGDVDTVDLEFKHAIPLGRHKFLWGGGYRHARDDVPTTLPGNPAFAFLIQFVPSARTLTWQNLFVQDEIRLADRLDLTVGMKLESNDYTGWEELPSLRLAWKPADHHLLWSAVSRAVRAPARLDREFSLRAVGAAIPPFIPQPIVVIAGGPHFESEVANVFELGYRAQPTSSLTLSVTGFHSRYDKLRSGTAGAPAFVENKIEGHSNGVEAWAAVQLARSWRVSGGFSTLRQHLGVKPGSTDPVGPIALGNDPDHQWMLRSAYDFAAGQGEFDVMLRRVGSLPVQVGLPVPAYTALDARFGWRISRNVDASLMFENLLDREHAEFTTPSLYGRSVFFKLLWRM